MPDYDHIEFDFDKGYIRTVKADTSIEELEAASKEYDLIYQEACDLIAEFDPCKVEDGTCIRCREGDGENFCCSRCRHQGPGGCTVKAIWCKLWFCHGLSLHGDPMSMPTAFFDRVEELKGRVNKLPWGICQGGRRSKEELFSYYDKK